MTNSLVSLIFTHVISGDVVLTGTKEKLDAFIYLLFCRQTIYGIIGLNLNPRRTRLQSRLAKGKNYRTKAEKPDTNITRTSCVPRVEVHRHKEQYAVITTALGIGSENNGPKQTSKSTMDPNPKNNRAAS